jgi:histidyl-tRNA synthetase
VEVLGDPSAAIDAEIMELGSAVLASVGVSRYERRINSGGCPVCRPVFEVKLRDFAESRKARLCRDCAGYRLAHNVLRIMDCKVDTCRREMAEAPCILDFLCSACTEHFKALREYLTVLEMAFIVDGRLVRGFDYYTRTVFEYVHPDSGALLGGGRYDGLVELLGGPSTPGTGWGMGLERVLGSSTLASPSEAIRAFVVVAAQEAFGRAIRLSRDLRRNGVSCEMGMEGRSLNSQMRAAGSSGATFAVIVGSGEKIGIKDLATGEQADVFEPEVQARLKAPKC